MWVQIKKTRLRRKKANEENKNKPGAKKEKRR